MPEMFVSTVGKSTKDDDSWVEVEDHFKKDSLQPTESVRVAAAEVAKRENKSVESVLKESEVAKKKIKEDVQKQALLDAGVVDYFNCPRGHAMFVALDKLRPDERFSQKVHGDNRKCSFFMYNCVCMKNTSYYTSLLL